MNLSLTGRMAVVCGSSQGIGFAIAKELALLGANCILLARNPDSLEKAVAQLPVMAEQKHQFFTADFSNPESVRQAIEKIVANQPVHILVNNTGGPAAGPIMEAKEDAFVAAFQQHVVCNHTLAQSVIPTMKSDGYGRIINIISTSVKIPLPNLGVSNTIRGAVASWAKTMSNELAPFGITVNNLLPGSIQTGRLKSLIQETAEQKGIGPDAATEEMKNSIPMKRIGEPEEIAAMAAFLASPAASYITGTSIRVDGGRTGSI